MISFIPPQAPVASAKEWSSCILEKKNYDNIVNLVVGFVVWVLPCYL